MNETESVRAHLEHPQNRCGPLNVELSLGRMAKTSTCNAKVQLHPASIHACKECGLRHGQDCMQRVANPGVLLSPAPWPKSLLIDFVP